ncbi:MAG: hypothetical protein KBS70_04270 [Bacteroidales bacterium]|nr:hypothetical protein [Candidatus Colicola equi]
MKTQNYQAPKTERLDLKVDVRLDGTQGTSEAPDCAPRRASEITKIP